VTVAINLLPWRVQRRRQRWRWSLLALAASVLLGVSGWWWLDAGVNAQLQAQQQRNAALERQWADVQAAAEVAEQQRVQQHIKAEALACLHRQRRSALHLFATVAQTIPDGVALDALQQQGNTLTLDGRAASAADLTAWLPRLHAGDGRVPMLTVLEAVDGQRQRFQLSLYPADEAGVAAVGEALCPLLETEGVSS